MSAPTQEPLFDPLELGGVTVDRSLLPSVELHPAVAAWFRERFPEGPTPAQEAAWPPIAAGEHTLVAAPTGSGKTLAGFLMAINRLYLAFARGLPVTGTRVVWALTIIGCGVTTVPFSVPRIFRVSLSIFSSSPEMNGTTLPTMSREATPG